MILNNKIELPIITNTDPIIFSLNILINLFENKLAKIPPKL